MFAIALFIFGALLGSFITVVAHRLPRDEDWVSGRSRCPSCGQMISARDNVPIVSWLLLRGHCRACGDAISPRYPLTEVATGLLFAGTYAILGDDPWWMLALGLVLCTVLVTITLTDLDLRVIPNKIVLAGGVAAVAILVAGDAAALPDHAIAATVAGGLLFLLVLAYPRGMGMGDVKLVAMMGLFLGRAIAPAVLIGFALGAVVGAAMIARHGASARKQAIPFGPFLAVGGLVGLWAGDEIVEWYLDEFFRS